MLKFKKIKGNLVHKTAVVNWKDINIGKGNIIGPYVVIGNMPQWKNKKAVGKIIKLVPDEPKLLLILPKSLLNDAALQLQHSPSWRT